MTQIFKNEVRLPRLLGMLIVGILLKNIPYNFGQFGRLECGDGAIIDSINDLDDIDEHSSWKRSVSDVEKRVAKRSVIHIENITHVNINISATDLALCDPRYIGHELDPFISRSLVTVSLSILFLVAGLELEPGHLWEQSGLLVRSSLIPGITEASSVAILSHFILGKYAFHQLTYSLALFTRFPRHRRLPAGVRVIRGVPRRHHPVPDAADGGQTRQ